MALGGKTCSGGSDPSLPLLADYRDWLDIKLEDRTLCVFGQTAGRGGEEADLLSKLMASLQIIKCVNLQTSIGGIGSFNSRPTQLKINLDYLQCN